MPRSYCYGVQIRCDPPGFTFVGTHLEFWIAGPPDALCKVDFTPGFITWSSNNWTLDHMIVSATYEYPPAPPVLDLPFYVVWKYISGENRSGILIDTTYGANYLWHNLPEQPGGYWLPEPLP